METTDDSAIPPDEATQEPAGSGSTWSGFLSAMKRSAVATGKGLKTLYQLSTENSHYLIAVLNGFIGDKLAAREDQYAIQMSFRLDGRDVSIEGLELENRLRGSGKTVVVFVHGLMCDEVIFQDTRFQSTAPLRLGYGLRLEQELGATVLYVRFNSGLHISQNGQMISELLEALVTAHGDQIDRLVIVAHSLGGLVSRSAGHYATRDSKRWVKKLSTVVLIGVPTYGSFLEQAANLTAFILSRIGTFPTLLGGSIIEQRSHGIKDLRFGLMVEQDWAGHPFDERLLTQRTPVDPLPGVDYHIIVGTLQENDDSPVALYFGDGLVGKRSAMGEALFSPVDPLTARGTYKIFPATGHFGILTSTPVGDHVRDVVADTMAPHGKPCAPSPVSKL